MKTLTQKDSCTPMFIAALFKIAKIWMQSKCPSTDEWIKMYSHTHTGTCIYIYIYIYTHIYKYYSAIQRSEILPFSMMWMDLESDILGEKSQTERQILGYHCGNLNIKQMETQTKKNQAPWPRIK